jgi:hypothetical protein
MLSGWLWFCLAVVVLVSLLGLVAGSHADKSKGELRSEYERQSTGGLGCGVVLILTVIALLWWLRL